MEKAALSIAVFVLLVCIFWPGTGGSSLTAVAAASSNTVYQEWQDAQRGRAIPIKLYLPTSGSPPFPVVIFSHGLGGTREAAEYLGKYWSDHGYLGVFVQHAGSDEGVWKPVVGQGKAAFMEHMNQAANGKNLIDRAADIVFVIDELSRRNQSDPEFKGQMDLSKIAISGHSFGAGTALTAAGQNFGGKAMGDPRVKVALYLCPPVMAGGSVQSYSTIKIPGMLLTGTEDNSPIRDTRAEDRRIPFDGIRAPHQYLVNFIGADHSTFGGRGFRAPKPTDARYQEMIEMVTIKFLDGYLKDDASARAWLDGKGITSYLGDQAKFERK